MLRLCNVTNTLLLSLCVVNCSPAYAARRCKYNNMCKSPEEACIEIRQCPYFADLLDRTRIPRPRHVIRAIREHQCGFMGNVPKVCCGPSHQLKPLALGKAAEHGPDLRTLHKPPDVTTHRNLKLLPAEDQCGLIGADFRITGGSQTAPGEFPWMALIAYMTKDGLDFRCGGSLINERYVLTAAHCVLNMTMVGVRLGEHNINIRKDCDEKSGACAPPVQDFYIDKVIVHADYIPATFTHDIALLRLATPANVSNSNVQPVCMPLGPLATFDLTGMFATVSGWGVTETGFKSAALLKIAVPVMSSQECRRIYRKYTPITERQICAGGVHGRDSCGGDSGGPLVHVNLVHGTSRYVQHGIVSYGPRHCGAQGQPGVYTRVASYMDWILDHISE